jgi:hypothetical protein
MLRCRMSTDVVPFDNIVLGSRRYWQRARTLRDVSTKLGELGKKNGAATGRALW